MPSAGGGRNEAVQEFRPKHALHLQAGERARQRTFACHPLPAVHRRLHRTAAVILRPLLPGRAPDQVDVVDVPIALPVGRYLPVPAHRAHLWWRQVTPTSRMHRDDWVGRTGGISAGVLPTGGARGLVSQLGAQLLEEAGQGRLGGGLP